MHTPTAYEQELLELINQARLDPVGEYERFVTNAPSDVQNALNFFGVDLVVLAEQYNALTAAAPVAWSEELATSADAHSQLMIDNDAQSHNLPGEPGLGDRIRNAGYDNYSLVAENIFAFGQNPVYDHSAFFIDWTSATPTGIQDPAGHRDSIMNARFTEVGIGVLEETNTSTSVGPQVQTQHFGDRSDYDPQLVGVVFDDADGDAFYDAGEGLGGILVTVSGSAGTFTTTTWTSGGYQLELPAGTYTIVFSDFSGSLVGGEVYKSVTIGNENVKVDANAATDLEPATGPSLPPATTGADVITGTSSGDLMSLMAGNDSMDGGAGFDTIYGEGGADTIKGGDGNDRLFGGSGYDSIEGGDGDDRMSGDDGQDTLRGGDGADSLFGWNHNDTLFAGAGDDSVEGGDGDDRIGGGGGNDTLAGDAGNDVIYAALGDDGLFGGEGNDTMWSGGGNDLASGDAGSDVIGGRDGDDTVFGGDGADTIFGAADSDSLNGGQGFDVIYGGDGNDTVLGGTESDALFGGAGADSVIGGDGNDTVGGGSGDDTLTGGTGEDTFTFGALVTGEFDEITDFVVNVDVIQLAGVSGATDAEKFSSLNISGTGGTVIEANGHFIVLDGVNAGDLDAGDFVFV